jgi:formylglycine-generating enzyme required for sulfatase activity
MVLVPAGTFIMGSDGANSYPKERPAHEVYLDAYYMDLTEITNLYYIQCVQEGPCTPPINRNSVNHPSYFSTEFTTYHDYPVINISWKQAEQYCEWRGGTLPSEAQWEKAARWDPATGQSRFFPWEGMVLNDTRTNYGSHTGETAKIGSFPRGASALGLLDMSGNVAEWVYDWYQDNFYEHSPHDNPLGPETGTAKVFRGGSYEDPGAQLTTTFRQAAGTENTFMTVGFRCAWTPGPGGPPPVMTPGAN